MTHDELLDKIYWHWRKDPRGDGLQAMTDYRRTILAVVELHKSKLNQNDNQMFCVYCSSFSYRYVEYPCPEVQAIEKELG
jgi:hypothetical protein